jgi:hypothetical protein
LGSLFNISPSKAEEQVMKLIPILKLSITHILNGRAAAPIW